MCAERWSPRLFAAMVEAADKPVRLPNATGRIAVIAHDGTSVPTCRSV
jgi:hypothetical protein